MCVCAVCVPQLWITQKEQKKLSKKKQQIQHHTQQNTKKSLTKKFKGLRLVNVEDSSSDFLWGHH